MKKPGLFLGALGLGAALAYYMDPRRGAYRRSLVRNRLDHWTHVGRDTVRKTQRDVRNRLRGTLHQVRAAVGPHEIPADPVLVERVRARLGHAVSNPSAVDVGARDGRVTLDGEVLTHEVDDLLTAIRRVPGVRQIEDRLERHDMAGASPRLLHPGGRRPASAAWTPARRFATGAGGGALAAWALLGRGAGAKLLGAAGATLLARSMSNRPLRDIVGRGEPRRAVDLQKTIRIEAPIGDVWRLWSHLENLPSFMEHLAEVRRTGEDRYRWVARGPGGVEPSWDARVTHREENRLLAWESEPGSEVGTAGTVRFDPDGDGTRIHVRMTYNPPAGVAGHALARLFGADARTAMDADLARLKSLLEDGHTTTAGREIRLEDLWARVEREP